MRLLLIAPASGLWRKVGKNRWFNGKTFRFSLLSLLSVAAETPSDVDVRILDEQIDDIPWNDHIDLVGITCMTALAPRAYEVAERFHEKGIPVVLGGMHPTFNPEEAQNHADAVVVGEAEPVWKRVLDDFQRGHLSGVYQHSGDFPLVQMKPLPRSLLNRSGYSTLQAVQATRGCSHRCNFCSVSALHQGCQRKRPVDEVVAEVRSLPRRFFMFVDDNLTDDPAYAQKLFEELIPLKKIWMTQSTLGLAENEPLLMAAAQAGCVGIFAGLETISEENLENSGKGFHKTSFYRDAITHLHSKGIGVEAGMVFGFDGDRPDVFRRTLDWLIMLQVDMIQTSIFTPLPGTPQFESKRERILDWNWGHYDFHHAVFQPRGMSQMALQAGHDWLTYEFYHPKRIAQRLANRLHWPRGIQTLPYAIALNMAYYGRVQRWGFRGWDPWENNN